MKKLIFLLMAALILTGNIAWAADTVSAGTVNITVLDENGVLVPDAPVYIYGEHKTRFVGGKEVPGTTTLLMPAGDYRISSALMKKTGEYFDRFASHEAHVRVVAGDNTVLVLTLKPINAGVDSLGDTELAKIGVPSDIARNLN